MPLVTAPPPSCLSVTVDLQSNVSMSILPKEDNNVRFGVFTAVTTKSTVF
jgi:hypothetical protein